MGNLGHEAHKIDYNEIARITAEKLGGNVNYLSAPAILGAGSISALNFLKTNPMLEKALEAAENADIFIFGIGSIESDLVYTRFGLIQPNELFDLNGKIVGDICGRFFDISGNEVRTAFEDRIIGIGLQKLINAQYSIALGGGTDKAAPLLGAIRGKFINGLVSDEQTIENILSLDRTTK
jgi:DNA-binding transcriptional regulator LsrR (DeoR family)